MKNHDAFNYELNWSSLEYEIRYLLPSSNMNMDSAYTRGDVVVLS